MSKRPATLSGKVLNCAIWIPDGYGGYKCGQYTKICNPKKCAPAPDPKSKQSKVCIKKQKVFSLFHDKMVSRCKTYAPACGGKACMDFTMPYPTEPSEKTLPSPQEIRSISEWMADQRNEELFEREPYLAREILSRGGIAPFKYPTETWLETEPIRSDEEYTALPLFLRNKAGLPCDEMANEMGYKYCDDLRQDILKAYPQKTKGAWKQKRRVKASEFIDDAYAFIEDRMEAGEWS